MHLNEAQANHLYDLLSTLVLSANEAFGIVPAGELLLPDGSFNLDACREVLDRVWDRPSLIDDLIEKTRWVFRLAFLRSSLPGRIG